jgi:hypothetical protein
MPCNAMQGLRYATLATSYIGLKPKPTAAHLYFLVSSVGHVFALL